MAETRTQYDIDQVRERTDVLTLIEQYVSLRKRGGRHIGLCPFHQEKTPSFGVDVQKGFWHCFGCGKGGDAFTFIMEMEKLTFGEAVERLAERAGLQPIATTLFTQQRKEERDFLYEINAATAQAFSAALRGNSGGEARKYLAQRGISAEQAARFGLGYAPAGWDKLVSHLQKRKFSNALLVKAGVALERSSGDGYVDRFRNRLMIPIYDRQGRVVAFGGRALAADDQPKYLNTAETPIFQKSRMLYALNWASDAISKRGRAIVTEGYFDVIACHLGGFTEAVATLGTALGEEHVRMLRRFAERVYLVFDADSAGIDAALRSQLLFRQAEMDVRIVRLPAGHDPDTLLREQGAEAFERYLTESLSPVEFELEQLVAQHPARDSEGRLRLFRAAAKLLQPLPKLDRAEYAVRLIERAIGSQGNVRDLQQALLGEIANLDRASQQRGGRAAPAVEKTMLPRDMPLERELLAAMVHDVDFAMTATTLIPAEAFTLPRYQKVFCAFDALVTGGKAPDARLIISDDEEIAATLAGLAMYDGIPLNGEQAMTLIDRLQEEHERRMLTPQALPLEREVVDPFTERLQQLSQRATERQLSDEKPASKREDEKVPLPDGIQQWLERKPKQ